MRNFCFWIEVKIFPDKKMRAKNFRTHEKCRALFETEPFHKISDPYPFQTIDIFCSSNIVLWLEHRKILIRHNLAPLSQILVPVGLQINSGVHVVYRKHLNSKNALHSAPAYSCQYPKNGRAYLIQKVLYAFRVSESFWLDFFC